MAYDLVPLPHHQSQRAKLTLRLGKRARLCARVEMTSEGLLAVGALVSSILLSTAVLVGVSVREGGKAKAIQR
jgi:hypothetical protein